MIDFYGMPPTWPGRMAATGAAASGKSALVEAALLDDVAAQMGSSFNRRRFVPFVVMHEFEGLLFSDCDAFARGIGMQSLAARLSIIRQSFPSPEDINDSHITAPSKRILSLVPGYQKPLYGVLAAMEVGLPAIRAECPHFAAWLSDLESWPAELG